MLLGIVALMFGAALYSWWSGKTIAWKHPPEGAFLRIDDQAFHFLWFPADQTTQDTYVFLHGASGNALDQKEAFETIVPKNVNRLYIDRPGHGWSMRKQGDDDLIQQSAKIIKLIQTLGQELGFDKITLVGHSFGAAIAVDMMIQAPKLVKNSVLLAPATHPWPSGSSTWYNELVATPIIGPIAAYTMVVPVGFTRLESGARCVFAPNPMPDDYVEKTQIDLVLRPSNFIANAEDVSALYDHVLKRQKDYSQIQTPIIIISGDRDTVVADWIHTDGLVKDTQNAESFLLHNLGHKPDFIAGELAIAAMANLNGATNDLNTIAEKIEAQIADDQSGPCGLALRLKREQIDAGQ